MPRLVVDTNVLVLYVIGSVDRISLGTAKRVRQFVPSDFDLLSDYFSLFDDVILLPNTATETANLLSHVHGQRRLDCFDLLATLSLNEVYVPSLKALARPESVALGLTDCALLEACGPDVLLLTADNPLHVAALAAGVESQLFSELRVA